VRFPREVRECCQLLWLALNDSAEADIIVGEMLDEMKDEPGAVQEFRAAVKVNSAEPNAHFGLGYMLWKLKSYEQAVPELETELSAVHTRREVLHRISECFQMQRCEGGDNEI
jgi:tetratricopeptide (TPR) repeat protein